MHDWRNKLSKKRRTKIKTCIGKEERNAARRTFVLGCTQWNVKQARTRFTCNFNQTPSSSSPSRYYNWPFLEVRFCTQFARQRAQRSIWMFIKIERKGNFVPTLFHHKKVFFGFTLVGAGICLRSS